MSTKVYGASDDLIEFEGDVYGEVGAYGFDSRDESVLLAFSDGTLLRCWYGKEAGAIWSLEVLQRGGLFDRIDVCADEDANPYSDVAHFKDGLKWAYHAKKWGRVT